MFMTQYILKQDMKFENLQYALNNYKSLFLMIRPFSLGNSTFHLAENLEDKLLTFTLDKFGLTLFTNKELVHFPLKDYKGEFKLEYRDDRDMRIYQYDITQQGYNYFDDPNDPMMPNPSKSVFRTILDDSLVEIDFEGKIPLELDKLVKNNLGNSYWKLVKK
jgi:hypothetical protein